METKNIIRVAIITFGLLLVPFLMMQFHVKLYDPGSGYEELSWSLFDFVVMGVLIFLTGLALDFGMRKAGRYKVFVASLIILLFLLVWAELAVGVFTN